MLGDTLARSASGASASTSYQHRAAPPPCLQSRGLPAPRSSVQRALSQNPDSGSGFPQSIGKLLKRVQSNTPILGLLSKLASPTGFGVDEISYPEYCRAIYNRKSDKFNKAIEELEARQGRPARPRYALLMMWMGFNGAGLVPQSLVMAAARRVRVTFDMEIEIDRFEGARDAKIKEYGVASKPVPQLQDQMNLAVDALCQLLFGVQEGKLPTAEEVRLLRALITSIVDGPDVPEVVQQAVLTKTKRLRQ